MYKSLSIGIAGKNKFDKGIAARFEVEKGYEMYEEFLRNCEPRYYLAFTILSVAPNREFDLLKIAIYRYVENYGS